MSPFKSKPGKVLYLSPHKTGSHSGEMNGRDWFWVRLRYVGAFVWTLLIGLAGQVQQLLPVIQGSWPVWAVVILGGLAAAIVRWDVGGLQRNAENAPSAPPLPAPPAPPSPQTISPQPPAPPAV